jgi:hypothetical protein
MTGSEKRKEQGKGEGREGKRGWKEEFPLKGEGTNVQGRRNKGRKGDRTPQFCGEIYAPARKCHKARHTI